MNNKQNGGVNWLDKLLGIGDDLAADRLNKELRRVMLKATDIISAKNVEIAQLTIDLAQKNDDIRRLEEMVTERNEELLDLHAKMNGFDKPYRCVQCDKTWTMKESPGALCPECGGATVRNK